MALRKNRPLRDLGLVFGAVLSAACEPLASGTHVDSQPPEVATGAPGALSSTQPQERQTLRAASDERLRAFLAATPLELSKPAPEGTGLKLEPGKLDIDTCVADEFISTVCRVGFPRQAIAHHRWQCAYAKEKKIKVRACQRLGGVMLRWASDSTEGELGLRLLTLACHLDVSTCEQATMDAASDAPVDALEMSKRRDRYGPDWGVLPYPSIADALKAGAVARHFVALDTQGLHDGLAPGAHCDLWMYRHQERAKCYVSLICEGVPVYGSSRSVASCYGKKVVDRNMSSEDEDPSLLVEDGELEMLDEGTKGSLRLVAREQ